ncbi:chromosome segregation protein SMC [Oceanobacillus saliphilus]|uniref:chromosome segregation protein SMC n=1 Tax=Oceanobacillus saliphilus TaxID=2925834 RepID=UPI00201D82A8|nr:chromosome segregation protein SMC [Oceanobacillus saliphilus]
MYLKRLESVGFKSFAERINVEFVPGVTAVVGPNGSGKSNITDAIRWVLGEQSAKSLRGSKMEDIIFQGSDTRKALNVAEVTLVLDNGDKRVPLDYDEISVTRRVYRSGESEFYINKQSCRLKDIIDLFMDSGLGREAFSIISQGKVEEILSSKAEERRTIFEEAAGVLKYKQRKKKSEYKLAETQENLNRVEDIVHEIEQQINPLQEQAETAKKYLELKDTLKKQEISYLITEIEELYTEWQMLLGELEKDKAAEANGKAAIQKNETELDKYKKTALELDHDMEELQATLLTATEQLEKYEGKKQLLDERSRHFGENKEKLQQQQEATAEKISEMQCALVEGKKKLDDLQAERKRTKEKASKLHSQLTMSKESISEQIEELKSDYIELLNQQAAKRNEKQSIAQQLLQINGKKDKQVEKFQDLISLREQLSVKLDQLQTASSEKQKQFTAKENLIKKIKKDLQSERNHFQDSQAKLYQGYQYIEKLKSKKEMLEEMKEDFQGFFHGVKSILKAREERRLENIYGAVIELIDVPADYITAIETVLGGQAQHIVVQDDRSARNAIAWLKKTNNGRATFLPLGSIQERFISKDILHNVAMHSGYIGIASELVKTSKPYQKAVNHLMGHVIIARSLKDANEIAALVSRRFRVVTLEGDVVNPGGSMSGGAQKKTNQSLFTREKDLQEMTDRLKEFQEKALQFESMVKKRKNNVKELENNLLTEESEITMLQNELQELRSENKQVEMKLSSINDNLSIYDMDKKQFMQDSEELTNRETILTDELANLKQQLEAIQKDIDSLSNQDAKYKENKEIMQSDLHKLQITLAEQEERVKNQREKTKSQDQELSSLQEQYNKYDKEISNLLEFENSDETEADIDRMILAAKGEKESSAEKIQQKRDERLKQNELVQNMEKKLKEEKENHQQFLEAIQQKEVRVNRLDVDLENRLNHIQTEYTMTYEKAQQLYEKVENIEEAKAIVSNLKLTIERLGNVNLGAIEEYERVSERYSFLTEQRDDLVEAKAVLYQAIAEMDVEMENRFGAIFTKIKDEFAVVFKQLFGGGHAELKLTDPKNLLDTGVDIIAQPPGKKLQHLGLLSGGERALTAIALLFAILRVRPVPFCILDEVEAALDEANVARFAKYVKLYSDNTQFIVITHRKGTMEEADVLYGVTMQESGVSRLVSVRLEETKELIKS